MVSMEQLYSLYPEELRRPQFREFILKEYIQYKMLESISGSQYVTKISFNGGTNLRIIHNNRRFSEDLDFDAFDLSYDEFRILTDIVVEQLRASGYEATAIDKEKDAHLQAFRRNIHFPQLLYRLGLTLHKNKRFLIKIEAQAHGYLYRSLRVILLFAS